MCNIWDDMIGQGGKRQAPYDQGFIISSLITNAQTHARKRMGLTYIYVLLLRKANRLLGEFDAYLVHASLQARKGKAVNKTEGAHQLLREVSLGNKFAYALNQMPQGLKGCLVYCASQVSVIDASYNRADQLLEEPEPTLKEYIDLVRKYIRKDEDSASMRGELFDEICTLFTNSVGNAKAHALTQHGDKAKSQHLLDQYATEFLKLKSQRAKVIRKSTEDWMFLMRTRGGVKAANTKTWDQIRNKLYVAPTA